MVGRSGAAELLGVPPEQARELTARPDFPPALYDLASGPLWAREDVIAWQRD
ncbi:DNA-binding protein [Herbidospora galbida]|uniref:DNA-binding protein n=1 Tax=Herbidospora galbida TaxID=2575442 RepID=A0A4U3MD09_9ACTN|nr:DNA-binding protein [Herbidospora galbida]